MRKLIVLSLATALLVGGCGGAMFESDAAETPTPEPTLTTGKVAAEASIEPARWSELRFEVGGAVAEVLVEGGETVEVGDVLARLDCTEKQLAVREAESGLASAEAALAVLMAGPRPEEIAGAEANLEEAEAALERAVAQRDEATGSATRADIAAAQAEVTAAEGEWLRARDDRDDLYRRTDKDKKHDAEEREQADYRFVAAVEALAAARAKLDARRNTADERVREAEARVASASAQRDVAKAECALLEAGAARAEIASAEAGVAQAAVALKVAEEALARTVLRAPFAGTVTKVDVELGDRVQPSQVAVVLATVDRLEAHTVDLTELDVARVREGQAAVVTADALLGTKLQGHVARIGLRSVDYRGDVTYPVTVELEETAPQLRWGMTALVEMELD
ncbi:MAG: HlyD family efflux transporter periplasmic adaptor subunit [Anaerolineae bacterium]|jgi:multidrug resistance efflux pump